MEPHSLNHRRDCGENKTFGVLQKRCIILLSLFRKSKDSLNAP